MTYSPTTWADRVSGAPGQFSASGAVSGNVTLTLNDSPSVAGTPITAARMNNIETGISTLDGGLITGPIRTPGITGATAVSRYVGATVSGPPTSGTFAVGDHIIAQNGVAWICTGAGSPGTWAKIGNNAMQVFTGNGTFTAPYAGTYKITCTGGGGAGGYSTVTGTSSAGASGGAAGGTAIKWAVLTSGQAVTVTIGAGGTQPGPSPKAGNPGGTSSFGAICSATGGGGGGYGTEIYYAISASGGTGSSGDLNLVGNPSQQAVLDYNSGGCRTIGACSYWGYSYGSGGDGYSSQTGKAGLVTVEWVG